MMTCCRSTRFASSSAYRRQMGARCCGPACSRSAGTWRPSKRGYTATAAKRCRHSGRSMNRMRVTCSRLIPDMLTVRVAITFTLMLLATGFAEHLPIPALLMALAALLTALREEPHASGTGDTSRTSDASTSTGSSMPGSAYGTPCAWARPANRTAHTTATVSRALLADTLTNRWNGER